MGRADRTRKAAQWEREAPPRVRRVEALEGSCIRVIWELETGPGDVIDIAEFFDRHPPAAKWNGLLGSESFKAVRLDANGEAISWGYGRVIPSDMLKKMIEKG